MIGNFLKFVLVICFVGSVIGKWDGNCNNPPNYDGDCCNETIFDDDIAVVKACATKFSLTLNANNDVQMTPANMEAYVCFTDCVYAGQKYINNGVLDMAKIKADVLVDAKSIPELGTILNSAMDTCFKSMDKMIEAIKKMPNSDKLLKGKCPATAHIIAECSAMDYYVHCPAKYWVATVPDCEDIKAYSTKCKLY